MDNAHGAQAWARWPRLVSTSVVLSLFLLACSGQSESKVADPHRGGSESRAATPQAELPAIRDITDAGGIAFDSPDADWIQVVSGSAWTTSGSGDVVRLEAGTGKVTARVRTSAATCTAMDVGFRALWVGVCSEPAAVVRIDPRSGRVVATIKLPGRLLQSEGSLAAGAGAVWAVTTGTNRELVRIDPRTNKVQATSPLPAGAVGARAGLGGLWVTDPTSGTVLRIDPGSGRVLSKVHTGTEARFFDVGAGAVWVQNNADGSVSRLDPQTNEVTATVQVDDTPISGGDLAIGGGFVWARISGALVAKIDPRTSEVVARYGPASGSGSVAADDEAVWITAHDVDKVYRLPIQ